MGGGVTARPAVEKEPVPTVVFIGRLSANKRPEHAIRAFGLVRRQMPDARAVSHYGLGEPKSTAGGLEISASFSTLKFCFGLYPNAIAVRLPGNERIETL